MNDFGREAPNESSSWKSESADVDRYVGGGDRWSPSRSEFRRGGTLRKHIQRNTARCASTVIVTMLITTDNVVYFVKRLLSGAVRVTLILKSPTIVV